MAVEPQPAKAPGRVLSTLNEDGSRRWIRPRPSPGAWWRSRRVLAHVLMFVFFAIPYLRIHGKPPILLDLPAREFTLFGTTFLPTDTLLFMLLFVSSGILIFLVTTLFGRVWCGWGCPQTVYMEYLFRPIERALEGGFRGSLRLDRKGGLPPKRVLKYAIYLVLSMFLAHTFLAYFVGIDRLVMWVQGSPHQHPVAFAIMAGTTLAIFIDFTWYREQTCLVACPYGRLQSVLFDRSTLIVAYDPARGEPRMKGTKPRPQGAGDCIECGMCVRTCPTGIDIRDGLQMECVHCTQCIDACDDIMVKIGQKPGLIRYASQDELAGRPRRTLRTRVVLYPIALAVSVGLFLFFLDNRATTEVTPLRGTGALYQEYDEHSVVSDVRLKFSNRNRDERRYRIELVGAGETRLIAPLNPFPVPGGHDLTATVFVVSPRSAFTDGHRRVMFRVEDGRGFGRNYVHPLAGPEDHERHEDHHEPVGEETH
jgi:cytochrome c oxidase accessory protein FixG